MNNIIKQEITVVQNKEGAIFQIGDVIIKTKTNKKQSLSHKTPSKILSFTVSNKGLIKAFTDLKYESGKSSDSISIDKIELTKPLFPRCFKIRSLGNINLNRQFILKINKILNSFVFSGNSCENSFYFLNLDCRTERGCIFDLDPKFQEVTIEQFLKYCEDEKI